MTHIEDLEYELALASPEDWERLLAEMLELLDETDGQRLISFAVDLAIDTMANPTTPAEKSWAAAVIARVFAALRSPLA